MTDRELLELAAKAAGIDAAWHCGKDQMDYEPDHLAKMDGMWLKGDRSPDNSKYWNPLTDDGDALRLAVKCHIDLQLFLGNRKLGPRLVRAVVDSLGRAFGVEADGDEYAATRRAIVRAAAEIGRTMT